MLVFACALASPAGAAPAEVSIGTWLGTAENGLAAGVAKESTANAGQGRGGVGLDALERELLAAVNAERAAAGVGALSGSVRLSKAADYHSREMIRGDYFAHHSLNGWTFAERLRKLADVRTAGEVIAYAPLDNRGGVTADAVMKVLMSSSPHRAQILKRAYNRIGVARRTGPFKDFDAAVFTIDFGRVR